MVRGRSDRVGFDELRRVLRLSSELRDLPHGSRAQKEHALRGLCDLVGAQLGLWLQLEVHAGGRLVLRDPVEVGWSSERERQMFLAYLDAQPTSIDPTHAPLLDRVRASTHITVKRCDVLDDRRWYRSSHVQDYRRAGDCDDFIYAGQLLARTEMRGISLHRPWGERQFRPRDVALVDAFTRESMWLHRPPAPAGLERLATELTPRLRDVLRQLARGLSEKQIAGELRISPHTVHDHVKALHRRLGVSSRGELLALLVTH
jgi:DNA-binding CsgD family transcriptional regulator